MRILHAYCLNYNLGDHALGCGVKHLLRQYFPVDFIAEINLQGQVFDHYFINILNTKYDLLVIGGGGIIHGAHWPNGWFWLIKKNLIKEINIPILVLAAGYNYFKDEPGIPEHGKAHLIETAKRALLFSVRNDGSRQRLQKDTGIDAVSMADPGFWVPKIERGRDKRPRGVASHYIVLQVANDKLVHRLGEAMTYQDLVKELRELVRLLSADFQVILCPHVWNDVALSKDVANDNRNVMVWPFSSFAFDNVRGIFGYYEKASAVLAMRGHGQILGMAFGVPTISLENHFKHRGLMIDMGLGEFNVDIRTNGLGKVAYDLCLQAYRDKATIRRLTEARLEQLWDESEAVLIGVRDRLSVI